MEEFEVTISYKAVISVSVKAESENDAKEKALNLFKDKERKKWYMRQDINLQEDSFKVSGCVNMSETWYSL